MTAVKKNRRKRKSKCTPTSSFAIEKTPFKDHPDSNIGVSGCFNLSYPHVLNQNSKNDVKGPALVKNVLGVEVGVRTKTLIDERLKGEIDFSHMIDVLEKLLKQHKRLKVYQKLAFKQICIIFPELNCIETYPRKVVFHMLYFIISHILPSDLLGSRKNQRLFLKSVRRIVYGSHNQSLSLSSVVHGLKVSHITWLQKAVPSNSLRLHVLACLVKWLLMYAQLIIYQLFHLSLKSSNEIIFYDKNKWLLRKQAEIRNLVSVGKLKMIGNDQAELSKLADTGRTQFRVKTHGLRPITVFKKPTDRASMLIRTNARMILNQLAHKNGATNTPFNTCIDQSLQNAILKVVNLYPDPATRPQYYFVRADVQDAFGSINHYTMSSILQDFNVQYLPRDCQMKMWSVKRGQRIFNMFESDKLSLPASVPLTKIGQFKMVDMRPILLHIRNHIHRLGTVLGKSVYRIYQGIPQGMHLSAILCEIYYSSLDLKHFKKFQQTLEGEIFVRYCDDYLFMTPKKDRAEEFLQKVKSGFPDFHVQFNPAKTLTNLVSEVSIIPFVGFFIDLHTFCVEGNFESYANLDIAHTISLSRAQKLGKALLFRMKIVLKLSPILINKRINSKHVIVKNIYHAGLFMAFRFCAFVNSCFPVKKVNQAYILRCVKLGGKILIRRVKNAIAKFCPGNWISREEIKWLVYKAFSARLARSAVWCAKTLTYLKATCLAISKGLKSYQLKVLEKASTPSLPGVFSTMKW